MQKNILRDSEINKIYLVYTNANGLKKKENVTLRYMGDKECYFASNLPVNFVKPKNRSMVDIIVYTVDGVFKSTVKILDSNMHLNEILFQCEYPKVWTFSQLRNGSRKTIALQGVLKFNDGESLMFSTTDISIGGFSFLSKIKIPSIYTKFSCICELEFPKELLVNFPDRTLITEVKFVRNQDDNLDETFYALKFAKLSNDETRIIKNFILGLP